MNDEVYEVSSEIYAEYDYKSKKKPSVNKRNVVSRFRYKCPLPKPDIDADGDLVVSRKPKTDEWQVIEIEHSTSTVLGLVGLQVWRGALLLADWLIYNANTFSKDNYFLELGSGVGLTSIVASLFAPVYCTDVNKGGILRLIRSNCERNKNVSNFPIQVVELDFTSQVLPEQIVASLQKTPIVMAADVVYDDVITDAFLNTVQHILSKPPQRSIYVALEKRYVFTIEDCDTVAPCYEYYLDGLKKLKNITYEEVPLDFPQYFEYERVKELVLWKLTSYNNTDCDS